MEKTQWWCGPGRAAACLGATLSILVVLVIAPAARADELAYSCERDICTIDPDHPATHANLTETPLNTDSEPVWSPDGTRIAWNGDYSGHAGIFTIAAANPTAGVTEVVDNPEVFGGEPAWSPDGTRIAFAGANEHTPSDENVYVSPADGTSPPQAIGLTTGEEKEPAWSPDSSLLAFARGTATFVSAPLESATAHLLANGLGVSPAWSPDGSRIATITTNEPHKVRLIDADGDGTAVEEPTAAEQSIFVAWSPDSSHVVYVDAAQHVLVAPTDPPGPGVEIQLPPNYIVPLDPSFSPDGTRVAFYAREGTGAETSRIFVGPASGGVATAVTQGAVNAREPSWKPSPGASSGGETPGGGSPGGGAPGGEVPGGGSPGGGSPGGGSSGGSGGSSGSGSSPSSGHASPPPTRAPVVLELAAFRHPAISPEFLSGGYVPCNLGSSNAICQAHGEATFVAPITHSLTYSKTKAKPIVFAKGSVTVPNGKTKPLPLKITSAGKRLLKGKKSLKLTETIVETAPGAKPKATTKTFTVALPKKP